MKSVALFLFSIAIATAFVIQPRASRQEMSLSMIPDAPALDQAPIVLNKQCTNYLEQQKPISFNHFLTHSTALESSSNVLSLKDRPPPPTAEEIAAKQRNFNFWFWGGGFVAPFLATFYYFGFKFWER